MLHFSRYFVVQSARQSRTARGRSSYRRESTYSHMQVNLRVYSELFSALLNIFASTPSRNRTYNCPLGGGCYIHLTTEAFQRRADRPSGHTIMHSSPYNETYLFFKGTFLFYYIFRAMSNLTAKLKNFCIIRRVRAIILLTPAGIST